ncbi:MAG: HD-GYP domain-containing protein [Bacillota bacterium]|nr:HD-GYP domain-containing protein [Bacillota bacterium]
MSKKWISIIECKAGDIIAKDVVNSSGVKLILENTVMNPYIINKLIKIGISEVCILDREHRAFNKDYRENIASIKAIILQLAEGKTLNVEEVQQIARVINNKIDKAASFVNFLHNIKSADEYTYTHCINTAFYGMLMAKWLGLSAAEINQVIQAGLLHDIGKAAIPNEILNKNGILTREEYDVIKQHTVLGYGLVEKYDDIDLEVKRAVLLHHERIDCSGYPFKASSESVGLYAKIIAVADVFDAMTSDRVYKKRTSPFEAFEMFQTVGVGIFDTTVMNVFIKNIAPLYVGAKVQLNSGEVGEVVFVPPHQMAKPIIMVKSKYEDLAKNSSLQVLSVG